MCRRFDFFFSWVFNRGKQIQFFNQFSTKRFTTLMCWSINWYSDKPPFSLNVLIRLILSPKLCSWEVSAMSSLLSPAEPCSCGNHRAECIHCFIWPSASGLNWDLGWWAKDWTAMQKKKRDKVKRREGCFYNASEASFKMSCLGVGTTITGLECSFPAPSC